MAACIIGLRRSEPRGTAWGEEYRPKTAALIAKHGYHPESQRGVDRGEALVAPPTSGADRLPARQAVADLNRRRVWQHEQRQVTAGPHQPPGGATFLGRGSSGTTSRCLRHKLQSGAVPSRVTRSFGRI